MGCPNTAQKRVLALIGSALRGDTGLFIVGLTAAMHANNGRAAGATPVGLTVFRKGFTR
jgi:hypothetical protein